MKDEAIVDLYLQKDQQAITASSAKYGSKLRQISFNIVQNNSDAEECENDTYLSAWNSIPPNSPKTFLFSFLAKVIRNLSINVYNKNHTQSRYANIVELTKEMEECIPSPTDEACKIADSEFTESINKFLKTLAKEERDIFVHRYWYSEPIKSVSEKFHISESKTKSMLMRTRQKLKNHFESEVLDL